MGQGFARRIRMFCFIMLNIITELIDGMLAVVHMYIYTENSEEVHLALLWLIITFINWFVICIGWQDISHHFHDKAHTK